MTGISLVLMVLRGQALPGIRASWFGSSARHDTPSERRRRRRWTRWALGRCRLRAASASKDPELRNRVVAIAAKIEWREPNAASLIRLDVADQPLISVVEGFGFPSPSRLAWHPNTPRFRPAAARHVPRIGPRHLLGGDRPRRTRNADLACLGQHAQPRPGHPPRPGLARPRIREQRRSLPRGRQRDVLPSNFQFAPYFYNQPGFEQPKADGSSRQPYLAAQLMVMAEPRLRIVSPVELIVREAVDDRGRSLIPVTPWRQALKPSPGQSYPNQQYVPIPLEILADPGKQIKRLAGSVSIDVADRKPGSPIATVEVRFDFADVPLTVSPRSHRRGRKRGRGCLWKGVKPEWHRITQRSGSESSSPGMATSAILLFHKL